MPGTIPNPKTIALIYSLCFGLSSSKNRAQLCVLEAFLLQGLWHPGGPWEHPHSEAAEQLGPLCSSWDCLAPGRQMPAHRMERQGRGKD